MIHSPLNYSNLAQITARNDLCGCPGTLSKSILNVSNLISRSAAEIEATI